MKHKIEIPIYFGQLIILQLKDFKKLEKKHKFDSLKGNDACAFRYPTKTGYSRYVLAFKGKPTAKIIAHEAAHIVNYIFSDRNIDLHLENDEPQCYLLGWIVEECHNILKIK